MTMTHQSNKQFNTYKEGLDMEFMWEYCMKHVERCDGDGARHWCETPQSIANRFITSSLFCWILYLVERMVSWDVQEAAHGICPHTYMPRKLTTKEF